MSKYYNLRSRKEPVSDEFLQHVTQLQKLIDYFDQETDTMSTDEKTQLKEECFVGDTMDAPIPEEDQPKQLEPIQGVVVAEEGSKSEDGATGEKTQPQIGALEAFKKHQDGLEEALKHLTLAVPEYTNGEVEYLIQTNMASQTYFKKMWSILVEEKMHRMKLAEDEETEQDSDTIIDIEEEEQHNKEE